eukprot:s86_g15.t2
MDSEISIHGVTQPRINWQLTTGHPQPRKDETGLIQKKSKHLKVTPLAQWHLPSRPPPRPVDSLLGIGAEVHRHATLRHGNATVEPSCFEHDCDYWTASGYSCEVLQDYYQCDCRGSKCELDVASCTHGTCNGHSCDYWAILHGMRCSAEPLSSCNCEGCRCIHDNEVETTEKPPEVTTVSETSVAPAAPEPEDHSEEVCEMCGSQDCNYWVDHQLFDCNTLINTYACRCRFCVACQADESPKPAEYAPWKRELKQEPPALALVDQRSEGRSEEETEEEEEDEENSIVSEGGEEHSMLAPEEPEVVEEPEPTKPTTTTTDFIEGVEEPTEPAETTTTTLEEVEAPTELANETTTLEEVEAPTELVNETTTLEARGRMREA